MENKIKESISETLLSVLEEYDARVLSVKETQISLNEDIERLQAEIQMTGESLLLNNNLDGKVERLKNFQKRIDNVNNNLELSHKRFERICATLKQNLE
jgi:translation initiation factor 2B subunit (eIF-2B alpha/beta/delta family)